LAARRRLRDLRLRTGRRQRPARHRPWRRRWRRGGHLRLRGVANAAGVEIYADLSPFSWYLEPDPLANGFHLASTLQLLAISLVAAPIGLWRFLRRDLLV